MNRRAFLGALGGSFLAAPLAAEAQQGKTTPKVGYLSPAVGPNPVDEVFEQSLQGFGWVRDQNVRIERRYSGGRQDALGPLAAELVGLGVDVLVAWSPAGALAAKRATSQIPVVFLGAGDPVSFGLVSNVSRPGGNVTGVSFDASLGIYPKGLQLLKEAVPALTHVVLLAESGPRTTVGRRTMIAAAKELGLQIDEVVVETPAGLDEAIRKAKDQGAQALYIWPSGFTFSFGKQISDTALANRLASIHGFRESATAGGLLSYAPSLTDIGRRGAVYVDKILRGARPGDLPVEQPTKFELVINLKTAKALGLAIPPGVLAIADEVIE
jgi:putative ABC transport system substrate-binding protein